MTLEGLGILPERARELIFHVARYGLTTTNVVQPWLLPELSKDAVRKVMSRSAEQDWLVRHPLFGQEPYFVLGNKALNALHLRRSTGSLGHQALLEHYAILLACARRQCDVFTEDEFRTAFPDYCQPGFSVKHFFADAQNGGRLGCFIVDHDKLSSRMVNKTRGRIGKLLKSQRPKLRQAVLNGELAFHIITATEGKRANLETAFARKAPLTVRVFVESFPDELGNFFLMSRR